MTLKEYIKLNTINKSITLLILAKGNKCIPIRYEKNEFKEISKELLKYVVEEVDEEEDDTIQIWLRRETNK